MPGKIDKDHRSLIISIKKKKCMQVVFCLFVCWVFFWLLFLSSLCCFLFYEFGAKLGRETVLQKVLKSLQLRPDKGQVSSAGLCS